MSKLSKNFKKEEVFYFTREVKKLLELLNGTTISCTDKGKIFIIENQMNKLENLLYKYEPTIYEEYSIKTAHAYNKMIRARKEYDRVVAEKCYKETIEECKITYENSVKEYERLKDYRNKLKSALIEA
ncbi:MAG: hypothetical protein E7F83_03210 [Clostridium sp.]|uniref:Uncharacterized protein n=1 Tax=Clostridium tertium TaxID=1559 RepID=A0A6N3FR01_9CLOT|nr:hypothetical protein [Clostridium sp.]MDU3546412.1 hypothetical protein [Clostridium sp.]